MDAYRGIGNCRLMDIKVIKNDEVIYEGMVEDAPEEIKKLEYVKVIGGNQTTFYVE